MPLVLKLFTKVDTKNPRGELTGQISSLIHTTRVHGGYWDCWMTVKGTLVDYWDWFLNRRLWHLEIEEPGGKRLWEGRLEDVEFGEGGVRLGFYGYWSNFTDAVLQNTTYTALTGSAIIGSLITSFASGQRQVSASTSSINNPAVNLTVTYEDLHYWDALINNNNGAANTTDGTAPWWFAVWDDRVCSFQKSNPTVPTWLCYIRDLAGLPRLRSPFRSLRNAAYAVFLIGTTVTRTDVGTNAASVTKYIRRDLPIRDLGTSNTATAENIRDRVLEAQREVQAEAGEIVLGRVFDTKGVEYPLCRVRAGDVLRIVDLIPRTQDVDSLTLDALRTFVIRETRCDHSRNQLTVVPQSESIDIGTQLAKLKLLR